MKVAHALLSAFVLVSAQGTAEPKQQGAGEQAIDLKSVPKAVIIEFKRAYPKATIKGCSKETGKGWTRYEIESRDGSVTRDILYDPDGTAIVIEESVPYSALPQSVRDAIKKAYPGGKPTKSEKIVRSDKVQYEVLVRTGNEVQELVYEPDGTLAGKEMK